MHDRLLKNVHIWLPSFICWRSPFLMESVNTPQFTFDLFCEARTGGTSPSNSPWQPLTYSSKAESGEARGTPVWGMSPFLGAMYTSIRVVPLNQPLLKCCDGLLPRPLVNRLKEPAATSSISRTRQVNRQKHAPRSLVPRRFERVRACLVRSIGGVPA